MVSALLLSLAAEGDGEFGRGEMAGIGKSVRTTMALCCWCTRVPLHRCATDHLWYTITDGPC